MRAKSSMISSSPFRSNAVKSSKLPQSNARAIAAGWSVIAAFLFFANITASAATFVVTNINDSGAGSLRQAILDSNVNSQPDTINFDPAVFSTAKTITLTSGMLMIERDTGFNMPPMELVINGPGADLLTISGNNVSRVISVEWQAKTVISGIKVANGNGVGGTDYLNTGGGILVKGGYTGLDLLTLKNSIVAGNSTVGGGGGGLYIYGQASIINCSIYNNTSGGGGAIGAATSSSIRIINSTISGNTASYLGAGFYSNAATIDVINTVVAFNTGTTGTTGGGGIGQQEQSPFSSTIRFRNSIVANNRLGLTGPASDIVGKMHTDGHNIIGSTAGIIQIIGSGTGDQFDIDPQLAVALSPNGGITPTHALLPASTAIDRGDNCVLSTPAMGGCLDPNITHDQRGVMRPVDGNGDGNPVIDVGPYEVEASIVAPTAAPDLLPASDTGISNSDNITNLRVLNFSVGSAINGATVEFSRDSNVISSVVAAGNTVNFTEPNAPANGSFFYLVRQRVGADWSPYASVTITIDTNVPTVTIDQAQTQPDPAAQLPINYSGTLSEPVFGFDQTDISLVGSNANVSNAVVGLTMNGQIFTVPVSGIVGIGTVIASIPANRFGDVAGNVNPASTSTDNIVTYDTTPPSEYELSRIDPFFATGRGFDDDVLDMALQTDGKLLVVGQFNTGVGMPFKKVMRLDVTGNPDPTFNPGTGANGDINGVEIQPDGKIVVGGNFTTFNGVAAGKVARLNSDGSLDTTFNTGTGVPNSQLVNAVAIGPSGEILIGGNFTTFNGATANKIAKLSSNGSLDQSFTGGTNFNGSGTINFVKMYTGNKIVAGGQFSGGLSLARMQMSGALDSTFTGAFGGDFRTATISGSTIFVGGPFGVTKLQANGISDGSFSPVGVTTVNGIAVQNDGKVVLSGTFVRPAGLNWTLTRLNSNGSADATFTNTELDPINSVVIAPDNKIIAGGYMFQNTTTIGGANRAGVRRINTDGTRDNTYLTRSGALDSTLIKSSIQPDGKILVMGDFATIGGLARQRFGRLLSDGTVDEAFNPAVFNIAAFAAQPDGKVIVGGYRFTPNGTYPFYRLNLDGSIDPTFTAESTTPNGANSNVKSLVIQPDGKVIAVGSFEEINGQPKKSLVRLMSNGAIDPTFTPNLTFTSAEINKVLLKPDGKIVIQGRFTQISPANAVLQLGPDGIAEWFQPISQPVSDMAIQADGRVIVSGNFNNIGGVPVSNVGRINANGSVDASFAPPVFGTNPAGVAAVLPLSNGKILIGGDFRIVNGVTIPGGFARLNQDGRYDPSFLTSLDNNGSVYSIAQQRDGKIVFGGGFSGTHGVQRSNISRMLPLTRPKTSVADFDGDGKTDLSIFRPNGAASEWWWLKSGTGGNAALQFGTDSDKLAPADFTGDGKTDVAFWRPATGQWFVLRSEDFSFYAFPFGSNGDVPVPADFDGDGKADAAVFRESTVTWYISKSSGGIDIVGFGAAGDKSVVSDYDGDGRADIAIFRPNGGDGAEWWVRRSSNGSVFALQFGSSTDNAVPGDYTGDGKADVAFWRPSTGFWNILRSEDFSYYAFPFGTTGDMAVPGDYDGDGKLDAAVFRPSNSVWYANRSTAGILIQQFGLAGDVPVPNAFVR